MLCPNESWVSLDDFHPCCTCLYPHTTWTDAVIPSNTTRPVSPTSPTPRSSMFGSITPDSPISKYLDNQDSFLYPEYPRFNSFFDTDDLKSTFLSVSSDIWSLSDESLPASTSSSMTSLSSASLTDPFLSSSTLFQNSEEFYKDLLPSPSSSTTCLNSSPMPSRSQESGLLDRINLSAAVYKDIWFCNTYDLFQDGQLTSSSTSLPVSPVISFTNLSECNVSCSLTSLCHQGVSLPVSPVSSFTNLSECNVSCSLTSLCHQGVSLPVSPVSSFTNPSECNVSCSLTSLCHQGVSLTVPSRRHGPLNKMVDRKRKRDEDDEVEVKVCKRARL